MSVDWSKLQSNIEISIANVIGADWQTIQSGVYPQIAALVMAARTIDSDREQMSELEYQSLKLSQQRALEGVLQSYAAITIVVADQAAAAAWSVVEDAVGKVAGAVL